MLRTMAKTSNQYQTFLINALKVDIIFSLFKLNFKLDSMRQTLMHMQIICVKA